MKGEKGNMGLGFEGLKGDKGQKGDVGPPGVAQPQLPFSKTDQVVGPVGDPGPKGDKVIFMENLFNSKEKIFFGLI